MKIDIPDVTLIAVSSIKIPETILSLQRSYKEIDFGAVKLISHERPEGLPKEIMFEKCSLIKNIMDYNLIVFDEIGKHIGTNHCLLIQYDSQIINADLWNNDWLQYDYIGAPWQWQEDLYIANTGEHIRVGNGGFSLRSKKLLDLPRKLRLPLKQEQGYWNEDGNICCYYRREFLEAGIKYAPIEVAAKFSFEIEVPENRGIKTFGFHRNYPNE